MPTTRDCALSTMTVRRRSWSPRPKTIASALPVAREATTRQVLNMFLVFALSFLLESSVNWAHHILVILFKPFLGGVAGRLSRPSF